MTIWQQWFDDNDEPTSSISYNSQDLILPLITLMESTIQQDWWLWLWWNNWLFDEARSRSLCERVISQM